MKNRLGSPSISILALALCLASAMSGCSLVDGGLSKDSSLVPAAQEASSGSGGSALQAFQTGFYAFAQQNCVQCHGASQSPLFAVSNVSTAYNNALPYVDFDSPSNSTFVEYAGNGHCGLNNCSGASQSAAVLTDMNLWAAAESSAGSGSSGSSSGSAGSGLVSPSSAITSFTAPAPIPSTLPGAGTKFAVMSWNLSNLSPPNPALQGAVFEVGVQLLTSSTYRVANPELLVPGHSSVSISGIHVMIRTSSESGEGGEYPFGEDWNSVSTAVAPTTIPSPLPTTEVTATALSSSDIPMPVLSSSDVLILGFESVSISCKNYSGTNGFESNVKPQMSSICFQCHLSTANNAPAYAAFPMVSTNDAQLCAGAIQFANPADPSQSAIVLDPQDGMLAPLNLSGSAAFNPTPFIEWIQTE